MPIPVWVQKHQVVVSRDKNRRVPLRFYPSGDAYVLPLAKFQVHEIHADSILLKIEGLQGFFQMASHDLEAAGWEVVASAEDGGVVSAEEWIRTGVRVRDREGKSYFISGVMGTEVVLREFSGSSENQTLSPGVTRMSISQLMSSMTPMSAGVPSWACVGSRVKRKLSSEGVEYTVRSIDTVRNSLVLEDAVNGKSITATLEAFDRNWSPAISVDSWKKANPHVRAPTWLKTAQFLRHKETQKSFWVQDVLNADHLVRVQPVTWVNYAPGQARTSSIATTWDTISFEALDAYEVLDDQGYPEEHRKCHRCGSRGEISEVVVPDRSYQCVNGHTWVMTCDDKGNMRPVRDRFDLIDS